MTMLRVKCLYSDGRTVTATSSTPPALSSAIKNHHHVPFSKFHPSSRTEAFLIFFLSALFMNLAPRRNQNTRPVLTRDSRELYMPKRSMQAEQPGDPGVICGESTALGGVSAGTLIWIRSRGRFLPWVYVCRRI